MSQTHRREDPASSPEGMVCAPKSPQHLPSPGGIWAAAAGGWWGSLCDARGSGFEIRSVSKGKRNFLPKLCTSPAGYSPHSLWQGSTQAGAAALQR